MAGAPEEAQRLADRYLLEAVLGQGGASVVYRAWDGRLGVPRAVKILHPGSTQDSPAHRRRLKAEARGMAALEHPHVLRVFDVGSDQGRDFVVMELAAGSLTDRLESDGPQPAERVVPWMLQVLSALAAAHARGVIHRDVKPHNLLLDQEGAVRLADFGIALFTQGENLRGTRTGAAMGSLSYMAPEQRLDARKVGPAADVYAAGASLYNLLTGASPMDLFAAPPDSPRWAGLAPALAAVVRRACRYLPEQRYSDAPAMAEALVEAMAEMGLSALLPAALGPPASWPRPDPELLAQGDPSLEFNASLSDWSDRIEARPSQPMRGSHSENPLTDPTREPPANLSWPMGRAPAAGPAAPLATTVEGPPRFRRRSLVGALLLLMLLALGIGLWNWRNQAPGDRPPVRVATPTPPPTLPAPEATPPVEVPEAPPQPIASAPASRAKQPGATTPPERAPAPSTPAGSSPLGTWTGAYNGRPATLVLRGSASDLQGAMTVRNGPNSVSTAVAGHFLAEDRRLLLRDIEDVPDAGTYELQLNASLDRFEGRFTNANLRQSLLVTGRRSAP